LPATVEDEFTMVGVTWSDPSGASRPRIELRTLGKGGWSDWLILEEEEASGLGRRGTSPAYVGPATGIEVRVTTRRAIRRRLSHA
jgi:hypothetical protein